MLLSSTQSTSPPCANSGRVSGRFNLTHTSSCRRRYLIHINIIQITWIFLWQLPCCHFFIVALERWRVPLHDEAPATKAAEDPPPSYSELFPDYAAVPQQSTDSNWRLIKTIASISSKTQNGKRTYRLSHSAFMTARQPFSNCQLPFNHCQFTSPPFSSFLWKSSSTSIQVIITLKLRIEV